MQIFAWIILFGFYLEIWEPVLGISQCESVPPLSLKNVDICANPPDRTSRLIDCRNDTISITSMYIGAKLSTSHCKDDMTESDNDHKERCCQYNSSDFLFDSKCPGVQNVSGSLMHYIYADTIPSCSGHQSCDKHVHYQVPLPIEHERDMSDYVKVYYECIPDTPTVGFCESETVEGSTVHMKYDKTYNTQDVKEHDCTCVVTSSDSQPIKIVALDVRLQDQTINMECHYTKLTVADAVNKKDIHKHVYCRDKEFLFGVPVLNSSLSKDFSISLGPIKKSEYPSFVWLKLEGASNRSIVRVVCNGPSTESKAGVMTEYIVIGVVIALVLTGIIITMVALCKHRQRREYKPPQPENIYFELETPEDKYDQIHMKQLNDTDTLKPDPSYGRLDYNNPEESHYAEPSKPNGKSLPYLINNDYATPESCRS